MENLLDIRVDKTQQRPSHVKQIRI